jgi:hypothetical protein
VIWIGLDAPAKPSDRFRIGTHLRLSEADTVHPPEGVDIARRKAERFLNMSLGIRAATEKRLGPTDASVGIGQISIERQRALAFGYTFGRAVCEYVDDAQSQVG